MRIAVCIKQVPDTETKIRLKPDASGIETNGIKWIVNPYDEYAIEESIKLRDANSGSQITVFTVGPKTRCGEVLRTALAMGVDDAVLIDAPMEIDNHLTARALSLAIKKEGHFDLVLTGKLAIDDNAASVSQMLANDLAVPHTTVVSKVTLTNGQTIVEREVDGGKKEILELQLPAVVAANKGLNMPRYASLPGIMKAKKKIIKEYDLLSLSLDMKDVRIKMLNFKLPSEKPPVQFLNGGKDQQVKELVRLLREQAKVL